MLACLVAGALLLGLPTGSASDAPHWSSSSIAIDCTSQCHVDHNVLGGGLTQAADNVNLCQSCHTAAALAGDLPIDSGDAAVRDVKGIHHAFAVLAVNTDIDTVVPADTRMSKRVMNDDVVCSTCHNQHSSDSAFGGRSRISPAKRLTALGSNGTVTSGGTFTGTGGAWYLIEITILGDETDAEFHYSKDNGLTWFPDQIVGTDVALDSGVTATFGVGSYNVGERWEFNAAWSFLRVPLDSGPNDTGDKYCRDCHDAWVMDHTEIEAYDGTFKSHPVGVTLNANGEGYDRAIPLDGNGADQDSLDADANPTNDLTFDSESRVQCLTCHGVHYVDSNTITVDGP